MRWLKFNLGSLGALTGTDQRALSAAAHIIELYAVSRDAHALVAFQHVVLAMQPKTREFAYHAIAHSMEWDDRLRVWVRAGLPDIAITRDPSVESKAS
ncbi:MAG: hypothetical protein JWM95_4020 [Gemmatimonadetes bacterium]|nr:hypothetical protein [Gemmatimonadota bacterium]